MPLNRRVPRYGFPRGAQPLDQQPHFYDQRIPQAENWSPTPIMEAPPLVCLMTSPISPLFRTPDPWPIDSVFQKPNLAPLQYHRVIHKAQKNVHSMAIVV